jgi:hypothetical protein
MVVRRKSEDGGLFEWVISRRPTATEIVNATATRRAVFAMKPAGLTVANSGIAVEDTFTCRCRSVLPAIARDTEPAGLERFDVARTDRMCKSEGHSDRGGPDRLPSELEAHDRRRNVVIITITNMRRGSRARQRYAMNGGFPR